MTLCFGSFCSKIDETSHFRSLRESKSLDLEGQSAYLPWPENEAEGFSTTPIALTPDATTPVAEKSAEQTAVVQ